MLIYQNRFYSLVLVVAVVLEVLRMLVVPLVVPADYWAISLVSEVLHPQRLPFRKVSGCQPKKVKVWKSSVHSHVETDKFPWT